MTIKYDMYITPNPGEEEKEATYYAKVIPRETVNIHKISKLMERESTLTEGDIQGVLFSLSYHLINCLFSENRVHIEGLGFFQLSITVPVIVYSDDEIIDQLKSYSEDHHYILRTEFERLFEFAKFTALKKLKMLVEKGVLVKRGTRHIPVYERGKMLPDE